MIARWSRVPIKTAYQGLYDGPHATPPTADEGPVFLGIGNVTDDGHLDLSSIRHIAEEDFAKWTRRVTPQEGDIVFTYEATLNRYAMIPRGFRGCLGRRMALIRPDLEVVDPRFLFYYFFSDDWRATIAANTLSGATVNRIPLTTFPDFPISLPRLATQRRIASILSAYDDLIVNNARRITILEEMARGLYEEWFVHFRFPGHEGVEIRGDLPEGWRAVQLQDVAAYINRGIAPVYSDNGPSLVINQKCVRAGRINFGPARKQEKQVPKEKAVRFGDVLINSTGVGTLGRVAQVYLDVNDTTVDTHVTIVRPAAKVSADFFGMALIQLEDFFESQGVGSTGQTELSRTRIGEAPLVLPPAGLQEAFSSRISAARRLCLALSAKNANLCAQRDLLLPKLISGDIDVASTGAPVLEAAE